jgi:hypothetical protein
MIPYHTKIRCHDCGRSIEEKLYLEREVNPDAYVAICEYCEPAWAALRRIEEKGLVRCSPREGIAPVSKAKLAYVLNLGRFHRGQSTCDG